MSEHPVRSLAKAVSWRIVGTTDTTLLAGLVTWDLRQGFQIGGLELLTKTVLYFLHERLWLRIRWGRRSSESLHTPRGTGEQRRRSLAKGVSWRLTAMIDTVLIAAFITGDVRQALTIGLLEVLTKIGLYYLHERVWQRINAGTHPVAAPPE